MWRNCIPLDPNTFSTFEKAFAFRVAEPLRNFLLTYNGGKTHQCTLTTAVKERRVAALLDFSEGGNAWEINRRMRKILGERYIVIGIDHSENFICVQRELRQQRLAVWNHVSGELELCTESIPFLLMLWQDSK